MIVGWMGEPWKLYKLTMSGFSFSRGMSDVQDLLKLLSKYQPAKLKKEVPSAYNHTTGLSKQVDIFDDLRESIVISYSSLKAKIS